MTTFDFLGNRVSVLRPGLATRREALGVAVGEGGQSPEVQVVFEITSFPKWGFGNASIAGKLCFAVRGWLRNGALIPRPTTQWNCAGKGAFPKPHFGNEGKLFKHRDRLLAATRLPEDKLLEALNELLEPLQLVEAASIPVGIWMQARRLAMEWT